MSLPRSFFEEIRARVLLSDVIGRRVALTRAGREFKACCPFHKEKTPSFTINDEKGFYHCFGCGAHGDVIKFLTEHENLTFMEAVEQLAGLAGLEVPQQSPEERARFEKQRTLYDVVEAATVWFSAQLYDPANRGALSYLQRRGLSDKTIQAFRLGFAPHDEGALNRALTAKGISQEDMIAAGLLRESTRGGAPFSFFRERIMFPVTDRRGRVVAFGGRVLPDDLRPPSMSGHTPPKYINSPDTILFHKGTLLYNLAGARQALAKKEDPVLLVEGYMDVIGLAEAGIKNAVAPLGTALTEAQILEMWRMAVPGNRVPVLCFDGDNAGQRAAIRAVERVLPELRPDCSLRFAFLPEGHDPDTLVREKGVKALREMVDAAIPLVDMLWRMESENRKLDTPEARAGFKKALEQRVAQIAHRDVQVFYQNEVRKRIDRFFTSPRSMAYRGGPMAQKNRQQEQGIRPQRTRVLKPGQQVQGKRERVLLLAMINHPVLFDEFGESLGMLNLSTGPLSDLRDAVVAALSEGDHFDAETLHGALQEAGHGSAILALRQELGLYAGFAQPDQPYETVREGWEDSWVRGVRN